MDYIKEEQLNNLYRIAERNQCLSSDEFRKLALPLAKTYFDTDVNIEDALRKTWNQYLDNMPDDEKCMACGQPIESGNCYYCKMD